MSATKRKFNALLQGLNETKPSSHDSAANAALLQKRRRLGFPPATAPRFDTPSFSSTLPSSSSTRSLNKASSQKPAIKFCPTDRDELLKRLATFQDITRWTPKPDRISEIEWAKRGWICQSKETVRCILCSKELVIKVTRSHTEEVEVDEELAIATMEALVDKYADFISSAHFDDCLWRKRGCADNILRLSLTNGNNARNSLRQRYDELCLRENHLPYDFNLRLPLADVSSVAKLLPKDFFANSVDKSTAVATSIAPISSSEYDKVAFSLALVGWQGLPDVSMGTVLNSISCRTCLRRLGLWMFKSKEVDSTGEVVIPAPMDHLDTVREHRYFCPWRNSETQSSDLTWASTEKALPGWQVLEQTLRNESKLRNTYEDGHKASASVATVATTMDNGVDDMDEDEETLKAKDKERWARLKKIKSLFDIKGSRKDRSRPGTAHSTKSVRSTGKGQ